MSSLKGLLSVEMQSFVLFVLFVISNMAETRPRRDKRRDARFATCSSWIKAEPAVPLSSVAANQQEGRLEDQSNSRESLQEEPSFTWCVSGETFAKVTTIRSSASDVSLFFFNNNLEIVRQEDDSRKEPQGGSDPQHRRGNTGRLKSGREKFCPNNRA